MGLWSRQLGFICVYELAFADADYRFSSPFRWKLRDLNASLDAELNYGGNSRDGESLIVTDALTEAVVEVVSFKRDNDVFEDRVCPFMMTFPLRSTRTFTRLKRMTVRSNVDLITPPTSVNTNNFHEAVEIVDQSDSRVVHFVSKRDEALDDHAVFRRRERSLRFVFVVLDSLPRCSSKVHNGNREGLLLSL